VTVESVSLFLALLAVVAEVVTAVEFQLPSSPATE